MRSLRFVRNEVGVLVGRTAGGIVIAWVGDAKI